MMGRLKGSQAGFTLIELVLVIAVVAILATIAVPDYSGKIIRVQVLEAIEMSSVAKDAVEQFRISTGQFPANNAAAGLPTQDKFIGNYVTSLAIDGGAIKMTFGNRAHNDIKSKVLSIRPSVVAGEILIPIAWTCGFASTPGGMVTQGNNETDFSISELPFDCRL